MSALKNLWRDVTGANTQPEKKVEPSSTLSKSNDYERALNKRRLESILRDAGMTRSVAMRIVHDFFRQ